MIWKDVSFNDKYEVSDTGLVRRKDTQHILKGCITSGYRSVKLTFDNSKQRRFYVHRLVATHFIYNSDNRKTFVNHKNGDKLDNRVENLEWLTPRENNLHYYQMAKAQKKARKQGGKPIPVIQYTLDDKPIAHFDSIKKAHEQTGYSIAQIARCVHNEISHVDSYKFKAT